MTHRLRTSSLKGPGHLYFHRRLAVLGGDGIFICLLCFSVLHQEAAEESGLEKVKWGLMNAWTSELWDYTIWGVLAGEEHGP